jgi:hypothetical protein
MVLSAEPAYAKGGEFGALECVPEALIHPALMVGILGLSVVSGIEGWKWRTIRTEKETMDPEERKALIKSKPKDKHTMMGSIILGGGVTTSILGAFNTYSRTGKLFPGPHLFAGAAITAGWAIAASLVPAMEKGNENARIAHISINALITALFVWQVGTGLEIT